MKKYIFLFLFVTVITLSLNVGTRYSSVRLQQISEPIIQSGVDDETAFKIAHELKSDDLRILLNRIYRTNFITQSFHRTEPSNDRIDPKALNLINSRRLAFAYPPSVSIDSINNTDLLHGRNQSIKILRQNLESNRNDILSILSLSFALEIFIKINTEFYRRISLDLLEVPEHQILNISNDIKALISISSVLENIETPNKPKDSVRWTWDAGYRTYLLKRNSLALMSQYRSFISQYIACDSGIFKDLNKVLDDIRLSEFSDQNYNDELAKNISELHYKTCSNQ